MAGGGCEGAISLQSWCVLCGFQNVFRCNVLVSDTYLNLRGFSRTLDFGYNHVLSLAQGRANASTSFLVVKLFRV